MYQTKPTLEVGWQYKYEAEVWEIIKIDRSFVSSEIFMYVMSCPGKVVSFSEGFIKREMIRV